MNNITVSLQTVKPDEIDTTRLIAFCCKDEGADIIRSKNGCISIALHSLPADVSRIVFIIAIVGAEHSLDETEAIVKIVGNGIQDNQEYYLEQAIGYRTLIFGEITRHEDCWKWKRLVKESNDTIEEIACRYGCYMQLVFHNDVSLSDADDLAPVPAAAKLEEDRSPLEPWVIRHGHYRCPYCANLVLTTNHFQCCKSKTCGRTFSSGYEEKTAKCPHDNSLTAIRLCPNDDGVDENGNPRPCRKPLWRDFETATTVFIGIIGSTGSGKTHFLTVLIEELRRQCDAMNWNTVHLMGDTITRESELHKDLYIDRLVLPPTNPEITEKMNPFRLMLERGENSEKTKDINLVFFDAAGEHYDGSEGADITELHRYLSEAAGIILLLDMDGHEPDDPAVMESLDTKRKDAIVRQRLFLDTLRDKLMNMGVEETQKMPLAITLSKADEKPEFMSLFRTTSNIPLSDWKRHGKTVREWFKSDGRVVSNVRAFRSEFFAVSALGKAPQVERDPERNTTRDVVPGGPSPMCVLDPLLWILNEQRLL